MESQPIQPGDRVIDLAVLAQTAGMLSGLFCGLLVVWLATGEVGRALALGVAGAVGGRIAGKILGRVRYTTGGRRTVVKHGPAGSPAAVAAALSASLPAAIVVWLGCLTILGGPTPSLQTGIACFVAGVPTGILLGIAASRL